MRTLSEELRALRQEPSGAHQWPPHRRRGTNPRGKTIRRLMLQQAMGWPSTSKLIIAGSRFLHPTKGERAHSPGRDMEVEAKHRLPPPPPRKRSEHQALLAKMTGWQITVYQRALGAARREGKHIDKEALARAVAQMPHWKQAARGEGA